MALLLTIFVFLSILAIVLLLAHSDESFKLMLRISQGLFILAFVWFLVLLFLDINKFFESVI